MRRFPTSSPAAGLRLLLFLCAVGAFAAGTFALPAEGTLHWSIRNWETDDGLPHNQVTGIVQTADGFLWLATYSAPARFDGVRFDEFRPKDIGLGSNQKITAVARAGDHALWFGTVGGSLVRFDGEGVRVVCDDMPYKPVQTIVTDRTGAVWMVQQGGFVTRWRAGQVEHMGASTGLPSAAASTRYGCALAVDIRGELWWAKNGRVGIFRDGRFDALAKTANRGLAVACAASGGVWYCTDTQLYRFREGAPPVAAGLLPVTEGVEPTALLEDRSGAVWIGTRTDGLLHYDGAAIDRVATPDPRITAVAEDGTGNIWVGTLGAGLFRVRPAIVSLENAASGLPTGVVQSVAEDATGRIWATTQNGLLLRKSTAGWEVLSERTDWPGGRASAVAATTDGAVWIGTRDYALHRWQDGAYTSWRQVNGLAGREIHALLPSRTGDVWLGIGTPEAVQRWHRGRLESQPLPRNCRVIRAVAEDTAGNVWFGTSRGLLLRYRDGKCTDETAATTGAPLSIRCLRALDDGSLLIGYADEGVGWLKDGQYRRLNRRAGGPENNVSQIVDDPSRGLWVAGDHGLYRVNRDDFADHLWHGGPLPHFTRFGRSEGLYSVEANFGDSPGATVGRDGRLWIPLRNSLAVVDPARIRPAEEPPRVIVRRVSMDDQVLAEYARVVPPARGAQRLATAAPLALPARHARLEFQFTAPDFTAPENLRFQYRMLGYDDTWINAGEQREAAYPRLPPGTYTFEVKASGASGEWTPRPASVTLSVAPFWWETWWFRLAAVAAFTAVVVLIVRRAALRRVEARMRALERQAAVQRERTRIARDLHDEFGTRLTELGLIAELEDGGADRAELLGRIRALERDLDTLVWAVNPKNDTLDHLMAFICAVTSEFLGRSGLSCRFDIPDDLPACPIAPELRHHLFLVVREAVHNVVKHGTATRVKISVAVGHGLLHVRVEDDGAGFIVPEAEGVGGNGVANMRSRIEESGGTFLIVSSPAGTSVEFHVPLAVAGTPPCVDHGAGFDVQSNADHAPTSPMGTSGSAAIAQPGRK